MLRATLSAIASTTASTIAIIVLVISSQTIASDYQSNAYITNYTSESYVGFGYEQAISGFHLTGSSSKEFLLVSHPGQVDEKSIDPQMELLKIINGSWTAIMSDKDWWNEGDVTNPGSSSPTELKASATRKGITLEPEEWLIIVKVLINDKWQIVAKFTSPSCEPWESPYEIVECHKLPATSALLEPLNQGLYTAIIGPANGKKGKMKFELFDMEAEYGNQNLLLTAVSTRALINNNNSINAELTIEGGLQQLLVVVSGPDLASALPNYNRDVKLEIRDESNRIIRTNDNWGDNYNASTIQAKANKVGMSLTKGSKDSAALLWIGPGKYKITAKTVGSNSGIGLLSAFMVN